MFGSAAQSRPGRGPDEDPAAEAWRLLVQVFLAQRDRFLAVAHAMGITPVHAHALKTLQSGEVPSMRGLARTLRCDASNVTAIIDRLEARGYVERRASSTDRRVKTLVLTDAGVAAADRIEQALYEPPSAVRALDPVELQALRTLAARLASGLKP